VILGVREPKGSVQREMRSSIQKCKIKFVLQKDVLPVVEEHRAKAEG
jgi:hypothetical protein